MSLQELLTEHSNDNLATTPGMVYQIWEDGEVTLQKSGSLLGQRSLHCMLPGNPAKAVDPMIFPHQSGEHGFAYVTESAASLIRMCHFN